MKTDSFLFVDNFPDEESCIRYLEGIRWENGVVSPYDPTSKVYKCGNGRYKCKNTGKYFDVKTGTIYARTKLPLRCWFYAISVFLSHKRGISSCQLARDLHITQKSAWNMLNKIRSMMPEAEDESLSNEVEIDETFVGGKNKNRHKDKKVEKCQGRSYKDKVPVFGMLERGGDMIAKIVPDTQAETLLPLIEQYVEKGGVIYTDGWNYGDINGNYIQRSVDHASGLYGLTYITPDDEIVIVSTNGIENAWSHFKRTIMGTYFHISKEHMQKYLNEFTFRFSTRDMDDFERIGLYLQNIR